MATIHMKFTSEILATAMRKTRGFTSECSTHLPQSAVYSTLTITSVGCWIVGIGRSSNTTRKGSLNTTACIVVTKLDTARFEEELAKMFVLSLSWKQLWYHGYTKFKYSVRSEYCLLIQPRPKAWNGNLHSRGTRFRAESTVLTFPEFPRLSCVLRRGLLLIG
jgi:hypothetical protein